MDETMNIQTAPVIPENIPEDIPENTLINKPQHTLKKKFCPATIPAIIAMFTSVFIAGYNTIGGISLVMRFSSIDSWVYLEQGIVYGIQFFAVFLLCILMFAKLNKPFLCVPLIVTALTFIAHFICTLFMVYDQEEFEAIYHNIHDIINYNLYTYSDYMAIRISYWVFIATMIFGLVVAAVYVILASSEKLNVKVRKLWFIPAIVCALSVGMYIVYTLVNISLYCVKSFDNRQAIIVSSLMGALMNLVVYVPEALTVILLCKWISNPYKKVLKKTPKAPVPAPAPVMYVPVPQPVQMPVPENQADDRQNNIELIKQYKDLLDMGAITQEEYDEKKKELL